MIRAIMVLQQEHKSMTKLLYLMRNTADDIQDGRTIDHDLLHDIGEYISGFPELCHHPKEDLIYRKLQDRNPEALTSAADLLNEHERLTGLINTYVSSVEVVRGNPEDEREQFAKSMIALVDAYEHHMEMEEKYFFPLSISKLSKDDWAEIDYAISDQDDPLFDEATSKYARLRDGIFKLAADHDAEPADLDAKALGSIRSLSHFNTLMTARGSSLVLTKLGDGSYSLNDGQRSILAIPGCSDERASWCAFCFVAGRLFR